MSDGIFDLPPRHTSTASPICSVTKYIFNLDRKRWTEISSNVRIESPKNMFSKGGMRVCFAVDEVEENGARTPCVAKFFAKTIKNVVETDYFSEGEAQCMCEEFANNFNRAPFNGDERLRVSFLQCQVVRIRKGDIPAEYVGAKSGFFSYRTSDTNEVLFVMEPMLHGQFTKYNSNFGETYMNDKNFTTDSQVHQRKHMFHIAEAFSHFTLIESGGSMLLCDIQGVNDLFTDPQIHTEDGRGLGMGNMGAEGIEKWVQQHQCNEVCTAMYMKPLLGVRPQLNSESLQKNLYVCLRADLQKNLVQLTKPIEQMTENERIEYAMKVSMMSR